jgi:hypothetical protein
MRRETDMNPLDRPRSGTIGCAVQGIRQYDRAKTRPVAYRLERRARKWQRRKGRDATMSYSNEGTIDFRPDALGESTRRDVIYVATDMWEALRKSSVEDASVARGIGATAFEIRHAALLPAGHVVGHPDVIKAIKACR